jgi:hypothetical protein
MKQQRNEDRDRTQEIESWKQDHTKDQAQENPEETKRIEELKKKQTERQK